jgi:hypothetical protein
MDNISFRPTPLSVISMIISSLPKRPLAISTLRSSITSTAMLSILLITLILSSFSSATPPNVSVVHTPTLQTFNGIEILRLPAKYNFTNKPYFNITHLLALPAGATKPPRPSGIPAPHQLSDKTASAFLDTKPLCQTSSSSPTVKHIMRNAKHLISLGDSWCCNVSGNSTDIAESREAVSAVCTPEGAPGCASCWQAGWALSLIAKQCRGLGKDKDKAGGLITLKEDDEYAVLINAYRKKGF